MRKDIDSAHNSVPARYDAVVETTLGTTITNVMQTAIAELLVAWHHLGLLKAICTGIRFGLILLIERGRCHRRMQRTLFDFEAFNLLGQLT